MSEYNYFASNFLVNIDKYENRKYLNNDRKFTRRGKISYRDTILYPLIQEGRTNSREANEYMRLITGDMYAMISQQAIGEKRGLINPELYEDMYKDYVDELYENFEEDLKYKDSIHFACDTSVIKVPNVSKTKEEFPVKEGNPARARLSTIADVYHGYIFDATIVEKNSGEVKLAIQHLYEIKERLPDKKVSVSYDRGFNSFELVFTHLDLDIDFLIRLKDSTLRKQIEQQISSDDEVIRLYLNKKITNAITNDELRKKYEKERYTDLRVTKVLIHPPKGKPYMETLLSTFSMDEYTKEDMGKAYELRWTIETDYDILKNILELENFTEQRRIIIEQDLYSKIFLLNLMLTIKKDADKDIQEKRKDKNLKHEYKSNQNHLLGTLQTFLYQLINCKTEQERQKITDHIMLLANQRLVLKEDERIKDPERHKGDSNTRFQSNNRKA